MTKFTRLRAEHTFAYELLEFDFVSGIYSIVGVNGASKSSIFLSLAQGLYNRNPKGGKVDDVSNSITGKPSVITIEWEADSGTYQVTNSRESGISVYQLVGQKWKSIGKKRIPENLKLIEELIGVPYETFCMLTFQDVSSSLDLVEDSTDSARKNFTNKVLQFGELDRNLALMKEAAKSLKKDIEAAKKHADVLQSSIVSPKPVGELTPTSAITSIIDAGTDLIGKLQVKQGAANVELARLEGQVEKITDWATTAARIEVINEAISRFTSDFSSHKEAEDRRRVLDGLIEVAKSNRAHAEAELRKLKFPSKPDAPETECSRCGQGLNNEDALRVFQNDFAKYEEDKAKYELHKAETNRLIAGAAVELAEYQTERESVDNDCRKWRKRGEVETELSGLLTKAKPEYDADQLLARTTELQLEVSDLSSRIVTIENNVANARKQLTEAVTYNTIQEATVRFNNEAAENNRKSVEQLTKKNKEIDGLEAKLDSVNEVISVLGPKGYRVHKMMGFLKLINASMIKYARMISGGKINCLFFVTEDGKIDFKVTDADKSLPYAMWSNGEKARVKLSCLFAVVDVLELMGSTSYNLLFLDEIFSSLDDDGKEGLFNVLAYLRDKGKCIYTISHTPLVNSVVFDRVINVQKENGLAVVS